MRVLVTAASRHGSTVEVAEQVARVLSAAGLRVDVRAPAEVEDVAPYDGVVLGSAIYYGRWMGEALAFVERHADSLARLPIWLFSVGALVGQGPDAARSAELDGLVNRTDARGHRAFRGALAADRLSWIERLMVALVRAPYGDFRDWTAVRTWAQEVGEALKASAGVRPTDPERLPSALSR
jgi:menaquinone-dependent protoporphyrinogen oxidase